MSDLIPIKRALISVFDKTGLGDFAKALHQEFGVELVSTGGTAKFLRDQGLEVTDVSQVTGFPEMMDGRVKTLHPKVHGGLLAIRDNPEHAAAMQKHGIQPIDLVCINLYPFEKTISKPGVTFEEAIENIDIGGPSMVRSAAKNHRFVLVVTSPESYQEVLAELRRSKGSTAYQTRLAQAQRAFAHTGAYDRKIAEYLDSQIGGSAGEVGRDGGGTARFSDPRRGGVATAAPADERDDQASAHWRAHTLMQRLADTSVDLTTFLKDLLTAQAVLVGGTEAAAFLVDRNGQDLGLQVLVHIRPDDSDQKTRDAAITAFERLIMPCVEKGKDGAINVGSPDGGESQFCLITPLRDPHEGKAVAVTAVITRSRDLEKAKQHLISMQLVAGYFEMFSLRRQSQAASTPVEASATAGLPSNLNLALTKKQDLRYGENPHQKGSLYVDASSSLNPEPRTLNPEPSVAFAKQHHGKELSYINLLDADGALSAVKEFDDPAACIVKHTTPCGCASANDLPTAFKRAYEGDPLAAFGGIVALNREIDLPTAQAITSIDKLLEVIVAPSYASDALDLLKSRWKNVRLLEVGPVTANRQLPTANSEFNMHKIVGGYLVQERDLLGIDEANWKVISDRKPTAKEMDDLKFAWLVCKHVKSNAIAIAKDRMLLGAGAGQMDRPAAAKLAIAKSGDRIRGAVAASDAFFPFPDGPQLLLDAGVTAIIQPGGSLQDKLTIDLVNKRGAAMVFTGQRHFKH